MNILSSLNLAQLETYKHVLQEMEARGVTDLATARLGVARETDDRHRQRQGRNRGINIQASPCTQDGCDGVFVRYTRKDLDGSKVAIDKCETCSFSMIVGDE